MNNLNKEAGNLKRIYKVELIIATIIICLLLGISIPRFMRVQISGAEQRIQSGLDTLFTALKAYANDHKGQLHPILLNRGGDDILLPIAKSNEMYFQFLINTNNLTPEKLTKLFDDIELKEDEYRTFIHSKRTVDMDENSKPIYKIHNLGISVINPNYEPKDHGFDESISTYYQLGQKTDPFGPSRMKSFLKPEGYYHISNGIRSFGIIYQDYLGNRSTD